MERQGKELSGKVSIAFRRSALRLNRAGDLKTGKTFKQAAEKFLEEYEVITAGERNPQLGFPRKNGHRIYVIHYLVCLIFEVKRALII